ncbi:Vacuolar membrane-associated protein IML1 [Porphyridium purpureum]|uniref:Vacuolar membrane-associated protein IML1 n=1 Tax=Porphyridium purpureum TaxID=35688 RepID=A0A5J4Z291_PORPP|nr:Vacuolar membrane-associated protein IML1 [Porphyridium purpureum]|eukprot:POR4367..scf295_1
MRAGRPGPVSKRRRKDEQVVPEVQDFVPASLVPSGVANNQPLRTSPVLRSPELVRRASSLDGRLLSTPGMAPHAEGVGTVDIRDTGNSFAYRDHGVVGAEERAHLSSPGAPGPPLFVGAGLDGHWEPIPDFEEMYAQMRDPETGIPRADRRWRLMTYSNCFVGSEAVDWLVAHLKLTRPDAVAYGQRLLEAGILQHVTQSEPFADDFFYYRFQEDEDSYILNMKRVWESGRPVRPALDVAQDLLTRLACLCEEHRLSVLAARRQLSPGGLGAQQLPQVRGQEDGESVDYQALAQSDAFRQYSFAAAELQRVALFGLDHEEKLAFFVNVYNALCLHCHLVLGTPTNFFRRWLFFRSMCYRISGLDFSLDDIEHGVLRGNKCSPSIRIMQQLRPGDPKCQYVLTQRDGRIHFVISAGTASDPPIRILDADNVEEELHFSTDEFLNNTVRIDASRRTVTIPRIFSWYADDFPRPEIELLKWIAQYLRADQQVILMSLINEERGEFPQMIYENFKWSNPDARFNAAVIRRKRRRLERERQLQETGGMLRGPLGGSPISTANTVLIGNSGNIQSPSPVLTAELYPAPGSAVMVASGPESFVGVEGEAKMGTNQPHWPEVRDNHRQHLRDQATRLQAELSHMAYGRVALLHLEEQQDAVRAGHRPAAGLPTIQEEEGDIAAEKSSAPLGNAAETPAPRTDSLTPGQETTSNGVASEGARGQQSTAYEKGANRAEEGEDHVSESDLSGRI